MKGVANGGRENPLIWLLLRDVERFEGMTAATSCTIAIVTLRPYQIQTILVACPLQLDLRDRLDISHCSAWFYEGTSSAPLGSAGSKKRLIRSTALAIGRSSNINAGLSVKPIELMILDLV